MARSLKEYLPRLFAEAGGAISFEKFMSEALYHPEFGYYSANIGAIGGTHGDFSTSATLSGWLGKAIAAWIRRESETFGRLPLIEVGAGDGSLMKSVLADFSRWKRNKRDAHIVETSPVLRECQRRTLRRCRIRWHHEMSGALAAAGGRALIFSNEFADAFPVVRIRQQAAPEGWAEVFVEYSAGNGLRETFRPLAESRPDLPRDAFSVFGRDFPSGQRVELLDSYRGWLAGWLPDWKEGGFLTIDYGGTAGEIYHRRPEGSVRAYYRHQRQTGAGVYRLFGRQDLTAEVCFEDLKKWGEAGGLTTVALGTQAEFIREFAPERGKERPDISAFLSDPDGAGTAFKVLRQRKIL